MHIKALFPSFLLASIISAATHDVDVGSETGLLIFNPNTTTAAPGDTIVFHFYPRHDVVQSTFNTPCQPSNPGFFSGVVATGTGESTTTFVVTINDTNPVWFYCSVDSHCQNGMVGVINPPSGGTTLEQYAAAAQGVSQSVTPANVGGGVFSNVGASASSSASTSSMQPSRSASGTPTASATQSAVSTYEGTGAAFSLEGCKGLGRTAFVAALAGLGFAWFM